MPAKMQRAFRSEEIEAFERNVPLVNRIKKLAEERAREMSRNLLGFARFRKEWRGKSEEGGARREKRIDSVSIRKVCLSVDGETLFLLVNTSAG